MKEEVVIIGAGRSGRGMLGEMYYTDGQYYKDLRSTTGGCGVTIIN